MPIRRLGNHNFYQEDTPPEAQNKQTEAEDPEAEDPEAEDPEAEDPEDEDPEAEDPEDEDPEDEHPEDEDQQSEAQQSEAWGSCRRPLTIKNVSVFSIKDLIENNAGVQLMGINKIENVSI